MSKMLRFPRINNLTISARLTRDPEIRYSNNNMMIARLGIAFDKLKKDEYGNFQSIANFMDAVAFGKNAEICSEQLHKGSPIIIDGEISVNSFTDQNGANRKNVEILINRIYNLERDENSNANYDNYTPSEVKDNPVSNNQVNNKPTEEDVPF
jgi:single-strand DNA-binding protein